MTLELGRVMQLGTRPYYCERVQDSIWKTVCYDCTKEPYKFGERNDIMQQVHIKFSNVEQVRQFVNSIDKIDANFDLGSGRKIVDAKSILGVMALDLSGPLQLRCHSDDKEIENIIAPFVYSEA